MHAAAGGAGRLIVQMARMRGARVFGTVSTEEKARIARDAGVDEVIRYTEQDFEDEARRLTDGRGVDVVYDSVGKTTFDKSLSSLRPRGLLALFGQSSGSVPPVDPSVLVGKGSLYLTRPSLAHYVATRDELLWRAGDVLNAVQSGTLTLRIDRTYPLADAAEAHRDLESRRTAGKCCSTSRASSNHRHAALEDLQGQSPRIPQHRQLVAGGGDGDVALRGCARGQQARSRLRHVVGPEGEVKDHGMQRVIVGHVHVGIMVELQHHRIALVSEKVHERRLRLRPFHGHTQMLDVPPGHGHRVGYLIRGVLNLHDLEFRNLVIS